MRGTQETIAVLMAAVLTVSIIGIVAVLGPRSVAAVHPDDAPDYTDEGNFTVNFPHVTDHYPGDQNEENGSIQYWASGEDAFAEEDAEEGLYIDWIIVHAEYEGENWIDYSACNTENTEAFGIDRGNNNSGTQVDEDLVQRQKETTFRDDGIVIEFFNWDDIGGDPPYMAPEDAIVAAQGQGSAGGPCLTLTDEPGWYRIAGFMNGTVADNGPDEEPSEDAGEASVELQSNYLYVCECDSEEEARDELGPPPNEGGESGPSDGGEETATPEGDDGGEETATPEGDDGGDGAGDDGAGDDNAVDDDANDTDDDQTEDEGTPSGDGPGFGVVAALVALLASALLVMRRR